jgi:hypothetical protein
MRVISRLIIATAFAALPRLLAAQGTSPAAAFQIEPASPATQPASPVAPATAAAPTASASDEAAPATPAGPSLAAATAGIHANVATTDATRAAEHHGGLGTGGALMIVGGAALIIGLIIGGSAGLIVAIAGAALGLYGLFLFLQ